MARKKRKIRSAKPANLRSRSIKIDDPGRAYSLNDITSLNKLLRISNLERTIKKAQHENSMIRSVMRTDPVELRKLHERSQRMQKKRRDDMLRQIGERQRRLRNNKTPELREDSHVPNKIDRICRDRSKRRQALFARKNVGSGVSAKKFKKPVFTDDSKIKC